MKNENDFTTQFSNDDKMKLANILKLQVLQNMAYNDMSRRFSSIYSCLAQKDTKFVTN